MQLVNLAELRFNPYLHGSNAYSLWEVNKIQHGLGSTSHMLSASELGLAQFHLIPQGGNQCSSREV